jgi:hypothetical protein
MNRNDMPLLRSALHPASRTTALALTAVASVCFFLLTPVTAMATEEPKYDVILTEGDFEVRQYARMVIAETLVAGTQDEASSAGFRAIAGYIFGDNRRADASATKIAMTAPVTLEKQPASQKIEMTAPVTMDRNGDKWRVHFVMPSQYALADLPKPNNPKVQLREIPAKKIAALRFSGFAGEDKVTTKTKALTDWVIAKGLAAVNTPQLARYDPPWTLPFMRRNEVLVEVR